MSTTYEKANDFDREQVTAVLQKYHSDLATLGVTLDVLMAYNLERDAVTLGGYPCQAKIKIIALKDRTAGRADAEILIDEDNWNKLNDRERDALIDHELEHLEPAIDAKTGKPKRDDLDRPVLKIRKHDWQLGWFNAIADRHGDASPEKRQAAQLQVNNGQLYFDFKSPLRQTA